jgi:predicted AlkP superfamily pyrophosphatase or phosphodiesterase
MKSIYPSQTYPIHASFSTGTYPDRHGCLSNAFLFPGGIHPPWRWYSRDLESPPVYQVAADQGRRVALLLWPGAAGARVFFNLPEIRPMRWDQFLPWMVLSNGTPLSILNAVLRFGRHIRGIESEGLDRFTTATASHLLRKRKPDLLMIHLLDLDQKRHHHGTDSLEAGRCLRRIDRELGQIMRAAAEAGSFTKTVFFVLGDHGHIDVTRKIMPNAAFVEAGLICRGVCGRLKDWRVWSHSCDGSAHIYLRDPEDHETDRAVIRILSSLKDAGLIDRIFERPDIQRLRLGGRMRYIIEAGAGCYFTNAFDRAPVESADKDHRSSHGYLPDRPGYQPLFMASGVGIRKGLRLNSVSVLDIAPTLAALLGIELPQAEGRFIDEMLLP